MNAKELLDVFIDTFEIKSKIKCAIIPIQTSDEEQTIVLPINYCNQELREFKASLDLGKTLDEDLLGNIPIVWFLDGSWATYQENECGIGYYWNHIKCPDIHPSCL